MRQIVIIHGGSSFNSYESYINALKTSPIDYDRLKKTPVWREWVADTIPDVDVLLPKFPNPQNANYDEWSIYFEKLLPLLAGKVTLVGYSLGAMFLAKYLNNHPLDTKIEQLILIAPCYDDESTEELGSFKVVSAADLEASAHEIHLFHSQDDPISPFTELAKFQRDLPRAASHIFVNRNHFFQPTFPELIELLKQK